jgi:hypothetical protein
MIEPKDIGEFVDKLSDASNTPRRTVSAVAGRFLEEAVELCLASGLDPDKIMAHVMDSIHNQCVKARVDKVIYPSQFKQTYDHEEFTGELADCHLLLKDLEYISKVDASAAVDVKFAKLLQKQFAVSESGTVYAIKNH